MYVFFYTQQVSSYGKGVLITGCETPIAWYLAKKLDDLGFTIYAGFNVPIAESDEAKILKEETSGRLKLLHVDVSSEKSVSKKKKTMTEWIYKYYFKCKIAFIMYETLLNYFS